MNDDVLHILGIITGSLVLRMVGVVLIARFFARPPRFQRKVDEAERRRRATISSISQNVFTVILGAVTILTILPYLGVNITPLLTSAGIVGVALGLGGQFYIRDVIAGLFIFTENQYRVGDVVRLDETTGTVEHINLRVTVLRDLEGVVHHIPNGVSRHTSNLSFGFSRCNFDVNLAFGSDLAKAIRIIDATGAKLAQEPAWKNVIKEPPHFLRVDEFSDNGLLVKVFGTTTAGNQWEVMGEMRRRLHLAFVKGNIKFAAQVASAPPEVPEAVAVPAK